MVNPKYTPGPWETRRQLGDVPCPDYAIIAGGEALIAEVFGYVGPTKAGLPVGHARTDAYLMAAAPDLFEACRMVLEHEDVMPLSVLNAAQRAINKAATGNA